MPGILAWIKPMKQHLSVCHLFNFNFISFSLFIKDERSNRNISGSTYLPSSTASRLESLNSQFFFFTAVSFLRNGQAPSTILS